MFGRAKYEGVRASEIHGKATPAKIIRNQIKDAKPSKTTRGKGSNGK